MLISNFKLRLWFLAGNLISLISLLHAVEYRSDDIVLPLADKEVIGVAGRGLTAEELRNILASKHKHTNIEAKEKELAVQLEQAPTMNIKQAIHKFSNLIKAENELMTHRYNAPGHYVTMQTVINAELILGKYLSVSPERLELLVAAYLEKATSYLYEDRLALEALAADLRVISENALQLWNLHVLDGARVSSLSEPSVGSDKRKVSFNPEVHGRIIPNLEDIIAAEQAADSALVCDEALDLGSKVDTDGDTEMACASSAPTPSASVAEVVDTPKNVGLLRIVTPGKKGIKRSTPDSSQTADGDTESADDTEESEAIRSDSVAKRRRR